jgi:hypothetical protein
LQPQLVDSIFHIVRIILVLNLVVAGALVVREVWLRPGWFRIVLLALSCFVFALTLPQFATGYYFAFDDGEITACIAAVLAYVVLMVLTVSSPRMASGLNRNVGVIGLIGPVVTAILFPEYLFVGLLLLLGSYNHSPSFHGRISPTLTYQVAVGHTFGNGAYYEYTLFRKPQRLPLVRKPIASEQIDHCEVPAVNVNLKSEAQGGSIRVTCQQHADSPVFTGEIPLDQPFARVSFTANK